MDTKVLRLIVGGIFPAVGIAIITLLACDTRNAIKPNPSVVSVGSVQIVLNPEYIRLLSSEAIDTVQILITVQDSLGVGMPDIDVNTSITPSIGYVSQPDSTDSLGTTSAMYISEPGIFNNVNITAAAGNKTATALLHISGPMGPIRRLIITPQDTNVVANGVDTASIYVEVLDFDGNHVIDGTAIYFSNTGPGLLSASQMVTINGRVRNKITSTPYNVNYPHLDSILVSDFPGDSAVVADTMIVHYFPAPIGYFHFVYPETTVSLIAGSGDTCSVIVSVTDIDGNPLADGTQITFKHEPVVTSSFNPQVTESYGGIARSVYQVGNGTGDDNVMACTLNPSNPNDTIWTRYPVVFHCIAPEPASLVLSTPNDSIPAGGASTLIIATVLDENGNPYDAGSPFWDGLYIAFDIMDSSGGASFDSLNQMRYDTVLTNINSQAIVQLFSGHRAGITVSIRACTVAYPPDSLYLCDQKPLVTITPGEPENITFAFSAVAQVEPGSQERYCQVGTIIGDRYSNPVDNGIPVHFSLFPPDLAYIDSISYTGHGNPHHPDSAHGVAYACIYYGCLSTFLPIQVVAAVGDPVTITDTSSNYSLPIYQGEIDLLPNPGNLFTADSSCDSRDTTWVTATLTDGGGCRINGGIIVFAAPVVGTRIGQAIDTTDMDGHAHTMFMIRGCDIPCSDSECTITATAKATLVQKPSVWSVVEIPCSRPLIRMR